ncbi:MAG: SirA protein [Rhodospirillaceae bacterium]|nr:MAG: SirA protein [Rhodospirillaceae bacterium]
MTDSDKDKKFDYYLDITNDVCPLTFVRITLLLERMSAGETAEVHLQGEIPLENAPRSIREVGETVLSMERLDPDGDEYSIHRMIIQKTKDPKT